MKKRESTAGRAKSSKASNHLESLPNIGKKTAGDLRSIGIESAEDFLSRDPYDVFDCLRKKVDPTLCQCALAGLVGAKRGVTWHKIIKEAVMEYEKRHPGHQWQR